MSAPDPVPGAIGGVRRRPLILIVDDEPAVLKTVGRRLQSDGCDVLTAHQGEDALAVAERDAPDLILLDVMMPTMKGREVCIRLKGTPRTAAIPVIFMTALGLADHVRAGMALGAEDYIVKPFEAAKLRERINVCLARHGKPLAQRTLEGCPPASPSPRSTPPSASAGQGAASSGHPGAGQ